ncbi:tetratricopeptide repeat protein [Aquimarina sp. Aq107]|uniref:tetratricopeptide repeat protein n=1 Tax=Aquimarina sp. Aq107 TaxID=1191912 RepID=UPI000D54EA81|nr:tetratricopeptide repeat protein [Aquimarina sp. Aq107]
MKFSTFILFIFLFSLQNIYSQNDKKLDSLLKAYHSHKDDSVKAITINLLFNHFLYNNQEKAKKYALEQLELSKKIDFSKGIAKALNNLAVYYSNTDKVDSSKTFYLKSLKIYDQNQNFDGITGVNHGIAILEYSSGNYQKAIELLNENIKIYTTKLNDSSGLGMSYDFIGSINLYQGNYNIALRETLKGLRIFEQINDEIRKADALNHLASIEAYLKNYDKSIEYNKQALTIYKEKNDRLYESQALNDIGNSYFYLKDYENAIKYLNKGLPISREMGVTTLEATILNNLGKAHTGIKQYKKAITYLDQSLSILQKTDNKNKIIEVLNDLGKTYNSINNPIKAKAFLNKSIKLATEIGVKGNLQIGYFNRSESYEKLGDFKNSLSDFKNLKTISDTIFNTKKSQQIEELKIIYETEKKEAAIALQKEEIKNLNQQVEISNLRKTLYAGGMISFIAVSGLLFFGFKQRIKKNKIEREKQEEIYKQEIEFKKKELTSQTLHLVQKNSFIQELKENLERIKNSPELFKVEFRRLVLLLKKESAEDKDWEVFKSYFADVHNNFDNKLRSIYAEISEKEIRLASFLRMNLTTKEIATMLNVLPDSVLKSKYRLKKKLNLDKETDLYQFLNSL